MGLFKGAAEAKQNDKLPPLNQGKFRLQIVRCIAKGLFKGGNAYIAEFVVKDSSDPIKHPIGSSRSWYQKMEPANVALGSLKSFASAVLGVDPRDSAKVEKEISPTLEDNLDRSVSAENAFAGFLVDVQVDPIKTRENKDFSRHTWSPVPTA